MTDDLLEEDFSRLVSPHGFDGRGPVPPEVTEASKTIAKLRVKFIGTWGPISEESLTRKEVDQLFEACAVCAEWSRELYEAVHKHDVVKVVPQAPATSEPNWPPHPYDEDNHGIVRRLP